jgi:hypothetical protein
MKSKLIALCALFAAIGVSQAYAGPVGPQSTPEDVAALLTQKSDLKQIPAWFKDGASANVLIAGVSEALGKDGVISVICPLVKVGADPKQITSAAIMSGASPSKVVDEASCSGFSQAVLIATAIAAGADPSAFDGTAAGSNANPPPFTPGPPGGGNPVSRS